jgi:hypothetical protein
MERERFVEEMFARETGTVTGLLYSRTAEMAVRLATIHAVSRAGLTAKITAEDFAWGKRLALWSADTMARECADRLADTKFQGDVNTVMRIIRDAGEISHRNLARALRSKFSNDEVKRITDSLSAAGRITVQVKQPAGGGTRTAIYTVDGGAE